MTDYDYIDRKELLKVLNKNSIYKKVTYSDGRSIKEIIESMPKVDINRGQRQFEKIIIENHKDKPYYRIQYIENGERYIGYSSYNINIVSEFIKENFIEV